MSNNGDMRERFSLKTYMEDDAMMNARKLIDMGFVIDPDNDDKLRPMVKTKTWDTPWIYVRPSPTRSCNFWHEIIFKVFGLFPIGCLDCWKVVIRPRTLKELFMLLDYERNEFDGDCKCGIEVRPYVHGNYGGYNYNNSLEEGINSYHRIRSDMNRIISPDVPVILKRACTEFELEFGDSDKWEELLEKGEVEHPEKGTIKSFKYDELKRRSDIIRGQLLLPDTSKGWYQPKYVQDAVIREWFKHAYSIGDPTALEFNEGGKPFYTPSITYHDKDLTNTDIQKTKKFVSEEVITK